MGKSVRGEKLVNIMDDEKEPVEETSSLLQVAAVCFRYRWVLVSFVVLGVSGGIGRVWDYPVRQTTGTLRFVSDGVTYGNRGFWDPVQKTRVNQLRALAVTESVPVSIRTHSEPWFVTVEVLHTPPGQGREVVDRLLKQLPIYSEPMLAAGAGNSVERSELLSRLQGTCARVEYLLQKLATGQPIGRVDTELNGLPWGQIELPSISGPGTPLAVLPFFQWLQRLKAQAGVYFAFRAADGQPLTADELSLHASLDEATLLMLRYRGALDLTAGYQPVVETTLDAVTEVRRSIAEKLVQNVLIGGWIGGLLGILICLPFDWLRVHWAIISGRDLGSSLENALK
ncbi:MAG: hypothetical protein WCK86_21590 [Planctomycetia bacterium]